MRSLALLLLLPLPLFAQTPSGQTGKYGDDTAKGGAYAMRYEDEMRARKAFDASHKTLRTKAFRDALRGYEPGKLPELFATWGEFMTATGTEYLALQLAPAAESHMKPDTKVVVFGEIIDPTGKAVHDFEEPASVAASKNDVYVERTLIMPNYVGIGTFGIAVGGEILGLTRIRFDAWELKRGTVGISRLLVSNNVYNLPKMQGPFDPFAFGGTKVVPKPDRAFRRDDELWLFAEVWNPAVDAGKQPRMTTKIEIEGNGKRIGIPATAADALPLKGVTGHFGVGTTVDLSSLKPGEYKVRFTLADTIANQTYQREETIHIVD